MVRDKLYLVVVVFILLLLQNAYALTRSLFFGGAWGEAYLWGGCLVAVVVVCTICWLRLGRRLGSKVKYLTQDTARNVSSSPGTLGEEIFINAGLASFLAFACVDLWLHIEHKWSAPTVPPAYQICLRVWGVLISAGLTWLLLSLFKTIARWRAKG